MTENEQIQEMARIAAKSDKTCRSATIALRLYAKGYRKASEVAREIFEEIEKQQYTILDWHEVVDMDEVAEIIKKYTEGEK